jgi:hypothetical protein
LLKHARAVAKNAEAAVPRLFDALDAVCAWTKYTEMLGLERETAMAFRTFAAQVKAWRPFLIRLQGDAGRVVRHRYRQGRWRDFMRAAVYAELIRIVTTYRRNKKGALLGNKGKARDEPCGILFEVAKELRDSDSLPCLPRGDAALRSALERAVDAKFPHPPE